MSKDYFLALVWMRNDGTLDRARDGAWLLDRMVELESTLRGKGNELHN